jgi:hypothetical protein
VASSPYFVTASVVHVIGTNPLRGWEQDSRTDCQKAAIEAGARARSRYFEQLISFESGPRLGLAASRGHADA